MLCELGRVPLQLFWQKMNLRYVARLSDLLDDRLVKKAIVHASPHQMLWWQRLVSRLDLAQGSFEGLLAEGAWSVLNAVQTLRDDRFGSVCQFSAAKTSFDTTNMGFDSDRMAEY